MALYLGSNKVKINLGSLACYLNSYITAPAVNGVMALSSDNYILTDKDGLYLTMKESE